jgi:uncharacterized DUF497 family protein
MNPIRITWDHKKQAANQRKHGVSFEEARSVFLDEDAKLINDPDHSTRETRFVLLGMSHRFRLLVVMHTYRRSDQEIRIISARKANKHEQAQYTE